MERRGDFSKEIPRWNASRTTKRQALGFRTWANETFT